MASGSPYKPSKKRHYAGPNPFVDNPKNNARFDKTIQECNEMGGINDKMKGMNLSSSHQTNFRHRNNPYIDPNLITHPSESQKYIEQHSVHSSNHCNNGNGYTRHQPQEYDHWNDAQSSNHESENEKIVVTKDNPYHPSNYYKKGDRHSQAYVEKYRSSPKRAKKSRKEYDGNVNDDFAQWAYSEFLNDLQNDHEDEEQRIEEKEEPQNRQSKDKLAIDDSLDGQEMISCSTFHRLRPNDTVFVQNDIGDWEIFRCKAIEAQGSTFVGTFSDGFKEKSIWAEQLNNDVVMAKYAKVDEQINQNMEYVIDSFIKITLENNREVLCVLKEISGSIAGIKDVRTGKLIKIDLNKTKHRMLQ